MRRLHILHRTYYNFAAPVRLGTHRLLLRPREGHDVQIESAKLDIEPATNLRWSRDEFDNALAIADFGAAPAQQLAISSEVVIRHDDTSPLDFIVDDCAVRYPCRLAEETQISLQPFIAQSRNDFDSRALESWLRGLWTPSEAIETYGLLWRLCSEIHRTFTYQSREQPGVQSASQTLHRRSGSCRDFARLFMDAVRYLGLPVRFISGYLYAPNSGWDFGATHAWAEVYLPGAGWKGFDPTIGELAGSKHIAVAIGRFADAVPPVAGSFYGASGSTMSIGVWVTELT